MSLDLFAQYSFKKIYVIALLTPTIAFISLSVEIGRISNLLE